MCRSLNASVRMAIRNVCLESACGGGKTHITAPLGNLICFYGPENGLIKSKPDATPASLAAGSQSCLEAPKAVDLQTSTNHQRPSPNSLAGVVPRPRAIRTMLTRAGFRRPRSISPK
jgi:hypothetical protein